MADTTENQDERTHAVDERLGFLPDSLPLEWSSSARPHVHVEPEPHEKWSLFSSAHGGEKI